jgi:hypothetical protein
VLHHEYLYDFASIVDEAHKNNLKTIQLLTGRYNHWHWGFGGGEHLGVEPFRKCYFNNCYAFKPYWLRQAPLEKSDAVLVHAPNLFYMLDKSNYARDRRQLWFWFTMEPQRLTFCSSHYRLDELDNWFNITIAFKRDSDILMDFKSFRDWQSIHNDLIYLSSFKFSYWNVRRPERRLLDAAELLKSKRSPPGSHNRHNRSSSVLWLRSHCNTNSKREQYVSELLEHINVDIYGSCKLDSFGRDPCANEKRSSGGACLLSFINGYKFYLAFENSQCDEYISEKFWKLYSDQALFKIDIVPVVRGARSADYRRIAVHGSYINADDFDSAKSLADYLLYLDQNTTAYMQYFAWKAELFRRFKKAAMLNRYNQNVYVKHKSPMAPFCEICAHLNNRTYFDNEANNKRWLISKWFGPNANCWDSEYDRSFVFLTHIAKFFGYCI